MGGLFTKMFDKLGKKKEQRILMLGLDAAGKTTVLYSLKLGEVLTTMPTIGFNVENVSYKNIEFQVWDIGGQDRLRTLWRHYFTNTNGIIFVVDSADRTRLDIAKSELQKLLEEDELSDAKVLVLANKQDLPGAVTTSEVANKMGLSEHKKHDWFVQGCSATKGDGIYEGLDWMCKALE